MTIIDGHNVLFTNEPIGEHPDSTKDIPFLKNRHWVREVYNSHLWIHNGNVRKNHTNFTKEQVKHIKLKQRIDNV